jgi:hypothetical protein
MKKRIAFSILAAAMTLGTASGIQALAHGTEAHQPAASEFGFGPRASAQHLYSVTLQPAQELRLRQLQTVRVVISDAEGRPVENAAISVDGGMPSHGHGLPTQPRVKQSLGGGVYEIEGVRFSMGGWWQIRLAIDAPAGADNVTFNLSL